MTVDSRLGLRGKVLLIAAAVLVAALAVLAMTSARYFGEALARAQLSRAQSVAQGLSVQLERLLALGMEVRDIKGFEVQCAEAVRAHDAIADAMVVSLDGAVMFHSAPASTHPRASASLLRVLAAEAGTVADPALGLHYAFVPARDRANEVRAMVVVATPQSAIDAARNAMTGTMLWVGTLVVVVGLAALMFALSRFVNGPLGEVVAAIEQLTPAAGARALPLPQGGSHELAVLVQGFNGLLGRLSAHESDLVAAKEAAESASRAKTDFLVMMSHELRTPMNAVLGMAELLATTRLDDRQRRYLEGMKSGSVSLLGTLNDILNYTNLETGDVAPQATTFSLRRLVDRVSALADEKARAKGLTFEVAVDAGVPAAVVGDEGRLRQVLVILLGNAIKFTHQGHVRLHVGRSDGASDDAGDGARLRFSVTDTGIGVDPAFRHQLFGAFAQQDTGYARQYGGTGLGLAIAKKLCEVMEGSIDMESIPGKGSMFRVELPLGALVGPAGNDGASGTAAAEGPQARDSASAAAADATEPATAARVRVLVVEDNPLNQEVVLSYLEDSPYSVTIANNGREGVERFERERFSAVLMDWQMPELDGVEATRLIRDLERTRGLARTPIIGVTAHALAGDRETCLAAGMDDYIVKPFTLDTLLAALQRWTEQGAAR